MIERALLIATAAVAMNAADAPRAGLPERCPELVPALEVTLLCPGRLPSRGWDTRLLTGERCEYVVDLSAKRVARLGAFHALAGGRCGEFSLRTRSGRWPARLRRTRDLRLVGTRPLEPGEEQFELVRLRVLRRVRVAGHRGLMLKAVPFPTGGVHGGHLAVIWNQARAGYALSLHFESRPAITPRARRAALLRAAERMSAPRPARIASCPAGSHHLRSKGGWRAGRRSTASRCSASSVRARFRVWRAPKASATGARLLCRTAARPSS